MPNSATLQVTLQFNGPNSALVPLTFPATSVSVAGDHFAGGIWTVPTTAGGTALPQGTLASHGGLLAIWNTDPTNYVQVLSAVSGTVFDRIAPGECHVFRPDDTLTAIALLANTATCEVRYLYLDK